ncbi:NAD-dependent epimerase/dehydratase family protein [Streptomyces sp. TR06-5]|uniref:NAD-dependent epimerase/dehydratase family protein n=1 Tax=unclassified Streptomyces TaxID=2593676 RepID=UPI0039A0A733
MPAAARTVLLTGAAGRIGTAMRTLLPEFGHRLRLFDVRPVDGAPDAVTADLHDTAALDRAVRGVDAIVHLAGISAEDSFARILRANVEGTWRLYEAARRAGVRRVVFASSNHAVGFTPLPGQDEPPIGTGTPHRPDTYYGLSKAFGEDLAQLYWDRHGMETVSLRIGTFGDRPRSVRALGIWLSPGDCARLLHASLTADRVGHTVVHGSSANTRAVWDLSRARALGYMPEDDSERYAPELLAPRREPDPDTPAAHLLGGAFCSADPPRGGGDRTA